MNEQRAEGSLELRADGTLEGYLDDAAVPVFASLSGDLEPTDVMLYGPVADLPWWKHWAYRIAGLWGHPYPQRLIFHGKAYIDSTIIGERDGRSRITMNFRPSGEWEIKE